MSGEDDTMKIYWTRLKNGEWVQSEKMGKRTMVIENESKGAGFQETIHTMITADESRSIAFICRSGQERGPGKIVRLDKLMR